MKLIEFPAELLDKIFSYLPSYGNVSLVCSKFYHVACSRANKKIIYVCLDEKLLSKVNQNVFRSKVCLTNRQ